MKDKIMKMKYSNLHGRAILINSSKLLFLKREPMTCAMHTNNDWDCLHLCWNFQNKNSSVINNSFNWTNQALLSNMQKFNQESYNHLKPQQIIQECKISPNNVGRRGSEWSPGFKWKINIFFIKNKEKLLWCN